MDDKKLVKDLDELLSGHSKLGKSLIESSWRSLKLEKVLGELLFGHSKLDKSLDESNFRHGGDHMDESATYGRP